MTIPERIKKLQLEQARRDEAAKLKKQIVDSKAALKKLRGK